MNGWIRRQERWKRKVTEKGMRSRTFHVAQCLWNQILLKCEPHPPTPLLRCVCVSFEVKGQNLWVTTPTLQGVSFRSSQMNICVEMYSCVHGCVRVCACVCARIFCHKIKVLTIVEMFCSKYVNSCARVFLSLKFDCIMLLICRAKGHRLSHVHRLIVQIFHNF